MTVRGHGSTGLSWTAATTPSPLSSTLTGSGMSNSIMPQTTGDIIRLNAENMRMGVVLGKGLAAGPTIVPLWSVGIFWERVSANSENAITPNLFNP